MEQTHGCRIMHARNGREFRLSQLPQYSVDGYCPETRTVFEFYGCYYHGCPCKRFRDVKMPGGETQSLRYERTMSRLQEVVKAGYLVVTERKCAWDRDKVTERKPEMLTLPFVSRTPLKTSDALYGGRKEGMCLHYKARHDESIEYADVMSLYPYICKYYKMPVGNPKIHVGDACLDMEVCLTMERLMKCLIVPPKDLYHPVLPFRHKQKLLFCMCRSCVLQQNTSDVYGHISVAETALTCTWVIDEVRLAVQKEYKILQIYEVYEYAVTQYDPKTGQGGLFVQYINTFLKLKAEASGYPDWDRTQIGRAHV
jgi:G:T-mismatch repair DNA endonuclease (very short patch repair protein)